ncbi:hypothetical protein BD413DRAFT_483210, partial [Trametes elegans]
KVRIRDGRCRATGSPVVVRNRGPDYTALEVAHVFPLHQTCSNVSKMIAPINRAKADERLRSRADADVTINAMLLSKEIHTCFDAYQFGIYVSISIVTAVQCARARRGLTVYRSLTTLASGESLHLRRTYHTAWSVYWTPCFLSAGTVRNMNTRMLSASRTPPSRNQMQKIGFSWNISASS